MVNPYRSLLPATVGFDRLWTTIEDFTNDPAMTKPSNYPPYNIIKTDELNYQIEIAVSGYNHNDIEVSYANNELIVTGSKENDEREYLYKGVSNKKFTHKYKLAHTIAVKSAEYENGMLVINLENVVPEEKKPRKIEIITGK